MVLGVFLGKGVLNHTCAAGSHGSDDTVSLCFVEIGQGEKTGEHVGTGEKDDDFRVVVGLEKVPPFECDELAGAVNMGCRFTASRASSGVFLYRSPSSVPGIPQERKYSKLGNSSWVNPRYRLPPGQPTTWAVKARLFPLLALARSPMMHRWPFGALGTCAFAGSSSV